jgi:hypothetical protein
MSEKIELVSRRRAFSLLGLAVAFGVIVPATVLTAIEAEAQTVGMERRQGRRTSRQMNRHERRTGAGAAVPH